MSIKRVPGSTAEQRRSSSSRCCCCRTEKLPEGPANWLVELKSDGYRAIAFKTGGKVHLRSRNDKDFNLRYPAIVKALAAAARRDHD